MKRYVKVENSKTFDILVQTYQDLDILSTTYKGLNIPEGELIPSEKDAKISEQLIADYESFVESVEDLLIDNYGLELTYFNDSDNHSFYYNFLAKDESGRVVLKFRLRLRISNHRARRTKEQHQNKKEEKSSLELLKFTHGKSLIPYAKDIRVNNKTYRSYLDAMEDTDKQVHEWVTDMLK